VPPGPVRSQLPVHVADACLRVLGIPDLAIPEARERGVAEIDRYTRAASDCADAEVDSTYRR
jgi:hypothetical protein